MTRQHRHLVARSFDFSLKTAWAGGIRSHKSQGRDHAQAQNHKIEWVLAKWSHDIQETVDLLTDPSKMDVAQLTDDSVFLVASVLVSFHSWTTNDTTS